jgi:hypothetical protein
MGEKKTHCRKEKITISKYFHSFLFFFLRQQLLFETTEISTHPNSTQQESNYIYLYTTKFGTSIQIKVLLQLAQRFLRRRFLCEFPIGSYVKLSSAVGAILVKGPNRLTYFWKRTIQWLFHQNFGQLQPNFDKIVLFQNCFWWSCPLTKMAAQLYLV